MNRQEFLDYYEELIRTGRIEEIRTIQDPTKLTGKDEEFFYYDDGEYSWNPFVGKIGHNKPLQETLGEREKMFSGDESDEDRYEKLGWV